MKKIINIRGSNCSGKSTVARCLIESFNNEIREDIILGCKTRNTFLNDGEIIVLGTYENQCGGCDKFKGVDHVKKTILYVSKKYDPQVIVYEGILYSCTYKNAVEIASLSRQIGYKWLGIYLHRGVYDSFELLRKRNGGKKINPEYLVKKHKEAISSYKRLFNEGYEVKFIDVTNFEKDEMCKKVVDYMNLKSLYTTMEK